MKVNWKALRDRKAPREKQAPRRWTINRRLIVLFAVLIGGFILVGAAYVGVVALNQAAERTDASIREFGLAVDRTGTGMLQARREEKDFFAKPSAELLQKHADAMAKVYASIDKAETLAPNDESRDLLGQVRTYVKTYHGTFNGVAEALKRAGYDDNSGLYGALGSSLQKVEQILETQPPKQTGELITSVLRMRGIEKDFLRRADAKFVGAMAREQDRFNAALGRSGLAPGVKAAIVEKMKGYEATFLGLVASFREISDETLAFDSVARKVDPLLATLATNKDKTLLDNRERHAFTTEVITLLFIGVLLTTTLLVSLVLLTTRRSITKPLGRLTGTLDAITSGDRDARVKLTTGDEMQQLGDALDRMMDERGKFMQTESENERLNNSVIAILRSVSQLGKGDLTVRVPVQEDITGALSDAINHMSESIGKTLGQASASSEQVVATSKQTRDITLQSRETVLGTARGMNEIRATIQETAKRIKRLGERSQEIGGIVKLIDTIAERTNMLALNANMQAAQAGEAGRGFMVVAAEVQRLAENAKDATHQIEKLVGNIQVETGDTIAAMDQAIEEVVEGSELAERAATQMKRNEEMVDALDALGNRLLNAVRAFNLPPEYSSLPAEQSGAANSWAAVA